MKQFLLIIAIIVTLISCKKLTIDSIAFGAGKLTEYQLDNYDGNWNFILPSKYDIDPALYNLISLYSVDADQMDSTNIYAVYIGDLASMASDTVIVYCHGQSANIDVYWQRAKLLANVGSKNKYGVLIMDYRGFGMSEGTPTEEGMYRDVETCLLWLESNNVSPNNTMVYGYSLGSVPAVHLAANYASFKCAKLILESPLASAANLAEESTLINLPSSFISTLVFDNAEKIKTVDQPFLWMHGKIDDYVSISNGEIIYGNYTGSYSDALRIDGANHGDIPVVLSYDTYLQTLDDFIEQ